VTPQPPDETPREPYPFWGYGDLAMFIGALLPSIAIAAACVALLRRIAPAAFAIKAVETMTFQGLLYAFVVGALYLIVAARYGRPFADAFKLRSENQRPWIFALWGPFLAISVSMLGVLLRAPLVPSPVDIMITGRGSLILVATFAVVFAPMIEELVFRGFLQPLFSRTLGTAAGILMSAAAFGLMHGKQSQWAWQLVLVLSLAGAVFGYVRHRTGSTTAAIALHAGYNATFFAGYLATR
jgi:membrane protease YdiL (CAAX protease family)